MKLVVEVLDASDLMPKDGHGSSSPFVEVEYENQRHRTQTKTKDLNPVWNEKLVFNVSDPQNLPHQTIDVVVYNDRKGGHNKNFLGRVRVSGTSVPFQESDAAVQRCPLDKRGLFSNIRGDIALKIYAIQDYSDPAPQFHQSHHHPLDSMAETEKGKHQKAKKKAAAAPAAKETRSFYSVGATPKPPASAAAAAPTVSAKPDFFSGFGMDNQFQQSKVNKPAAEMHRDQAAPPPVSVVMQHMRMPVEPDFGIVEIDPPLAARRGYKHDKITGTYDLVEQMHYLYVNVVKARDLPTMDITGSLDPYVEIKLGNYKGATKWLEKNQNPVYNQVFAFSKEKMQSHSLQVMVKDKDLVKDDFVGRVEFELSEVPLRVPPDSPLAPQWYKLVDKKGEKTKGEIMLAVWMGTQADEAFPNAWHSDAHSISLDGLSNSRSKVYFAPKLCYLRVLIVEAQDLVVSDKSRVPDVFVKIQLGNQVLRTRPSQFNRSVNPVWNESFMFVVATDPFEEHLIITVEDRVGANKDEPLGKVVLPVSAAQPRPDHHRTVLPRWFNLDKPSSSSSVENGEKKKEVKFASKIHLGIVLETGYHVLDESTHYSSDLQPSEKHLRKPSIGILELGILSARNLLPMKKDSRTDAYCIAKYGQKWVRTRTLLDTLAPRWNEQYTWEVHDPCTVITIGVFDNCHIGHAEDAKDQKIGKVRIRLSTLEIDRVYSHNYSLLVLQRSGLKKTGDLQLALRFTCMGWVNMIGLYAKPLLPKMHYISPIPVIQHNYLRQQAIQIVAARLARAEPPLRREVVEYMLDLDFHMFSLRRSKANFGRITYVLSGVGAMGKWFDDIRNWKNRVTTVLVHVLFLILVGFPELILPTIFLYLFMIGLWNYRFRPRHPPYMDARMSHALSHMVHPDELDEEFDTFPTSRPSDIVRMRYDRMRSVAGRLQTVVGDLATQGERAQAILSWRDPRATAIFITFSLIFAVVLYVTPFQGIAVLVGFYLLRHPRFRTKLPSVPFNFYRRLPAKSDMLI